MSDKITAKNLTYDQTLPPFLARLRGQHQAPGDGPDPILAARRRTARVRTASEEAEDAPLVLDEAGNVVDMKTAGELLPTDDEDDDDAAKKKGGDEAKEKEEEQQQQPVKEAAAIGASKKRKVGRVIGGDDDEKDEREVSQAVKAAKAIAGEGECDDDDDDGQDNNEFEAIWGGKKKAKKIKLSFGDDEAD
ncbi:hypothetical protein PG995_012875 [Apiospora arundinis]